MESSAALPHAARELLLKGGGCAVNFECAPELCAPLRAELARSGRSVGFVRADEGFYDRMDTAAYLRLFERMAASAAHTAAPFDAGPAQAAFHRAGDRPRSRGVLHRRTVGRAGRGRMQAYSGMDGRRAVHRPALHRGHGFHAHGLSAAGRALPFGRE